MASTIPHQPVDEQTLSSLIPLARGIARKISNTDEAESDALVALWKGLQRYDPKRGASPTTFLSYCIRGAVLDGLRERDHLSRAERTRVKAGLAEDRAPVSLDALREMIGYDAPALSVVDVEQVETERRLKARTDALWQLVAMALDYRSATFLRMYYVEGRKLHEIGALFEVTESRVSQVVARALDSIREMVAGSDHDPTTP